MKLTNTEKAIAQLEDEIKVRQLAIDRFKSTVTQKAKKAKPRLVAGGESAS